MKTWLKRSGQVLGVLAGLMVVLVLGVYAVTSHRLSTSYDVSVRAPQIPSDQASIARGRHFAVAIAKCAECHGSDFGGREMVNDPAFGLLWAANLTGGHGGVGRAYTDEDWVRAVRHGVDREGKPLVFMPSDELRVMSDADLAAVIAFLRSVPPVNREVPARRVGPVARALSLSPSFPLIPARLIDHDAAPPPAPVQAVSVAYGKYLTTVGLCTGCHRPDLSGGGGPPPGAPNITPDPETGIGRWTEADFFQALRTGMRPDRSVLNTVMPWVPAGQMTDDEIRATWLFLRSVPARRNPERRAGG